MVTYEYPESGASNETVAVLEDGRRIAIDGQYNVASPYGQHAADCAQLTKIGGRCDCGLLDGIDVAALVADAKVRGLFGRAPRPPRPAAKRQLPPAKVCPICGTYCYGDCTAR